MPLGVLLRDVLQVFEEFLQVVRIIFLGTGITGGIDARSSVEGIHFQSGVICKAGKTKTVPQVLRFFLRIAFKGGCICGDLFGAAQGLGGGSFEAGPQNFLGFPELVHVSGGKNDFHTWSDCCSKVMKRLILHLRKTNEK